MSFRKYAVGSLIVSGLLLVCGSVQAASASMDDRTDCDDTTCEVYWMMPGSTGGEVTWPQELVTQDEVACGFFYQVDRYPSDKIDALVKDGQLTEGEDYGIAISWRIEYIGDCPPDTSTPTPTETEEPSSTPSTHPSMEPSSPTPPTTVPESPSAASTTGATTPTVKPSTSDTPSSTTSTAAHPPTVSTGSSSTPETPIASSATNTSRNQLADTGSNLTFLFPVGLVVIVLGILGFAWGRKPKTK